MSRIRVLLFTIISLLLAPSAFAQGEKPVEGSNFFLTKKNCPDGKICVRVGLVDLHTPDFAKLFGVTPDSIRVENPLSTLALCKAHNGRQGWHRTRVRTIQDRASNAVWKNCAPEDRYTYIVPGELIQLSGITYASQEDERRILGELRGCASPECAFALIPPLAPKVKDWNITSAIGAPIESGSTDLPPVAKRSPEPPSSTLNTPLKKETTIAKATTASSINWWMIATIALASIVLLLGIWVIRLKRQIRDETKRHVAEMGERGQEREHELERARQEAGKYQQTIEQMRQKMELVLLALNDLRVNARLPQVNELTATAVGEMQDAIEARLQSVTDRVGKEIVELKGALIEACTFFGGRAQISQTSREVNAATIEAMHAFQAELQSRSVELIHLVDASVETQKVPTELRMLGVGIQTLTHLVEDARSVIGWSYQELREKPPKRPPIGSISDAVTYLRERVEELSSRQVQLRGESKSAALRIAQLEEENQQLQQSGTPSDEELMSEFATGRRESPTLTSAPYTRMPTLPPPSDKGVPPAPEIDERPPERIAAFSWMERFIADNKDHVIVGLHPRELGVIARLKHFIGPRRFQVFGSSVPAALLADMLNPDSSVHRDLAQQGLIVARA